MSRSYLTVDIETLRDPAMPEYVPRPDRDPFPPPPYWRIACMGLLAADADLRVTSIRCAFAPMPEAQIVDDFARLTNDRPTLVTFNGRGFDLPVIAARCMRHGIPCPYLFEKDVSYRYTTSGHYDVMDALQDFGAGRPASLDAWARTIGMPGKLDMGGGDVAVLLHEGQIEKVAAYCMGDVVQTWAVTVRHMLIRGFIGFEEHETAMRSLLEYIDGAEPLAPFRERIDRTALITAIEPAYAEPLPRSTS